MDIKSNSDSVFDYTRLRWLYTIVLCMFIILGFRLIYLQIILSNKLVSEGNKRSLRIQNISESRGLITDRMGRLLAMNVPVDSVWIDPQKINKCGGIYSNISDWVKLSNLLNFSLEKLLSCLNNNSIRFLYLARHVDPDIAEYVNQLQLSGVYLKRESKRYYPSGSVSAHLVGITDIDNKGIEGIEKSFDSWLSGCPKVKVIQKDRSGQVVEDVSVLNSGRSSKNIILSIDERLQYFAYTELNKVVAMNHAKSGSIVLIDIKTGEILIMVNSPSYDPNNLIIYDRSIMRNRAITDVFEPGSTVKPIVIMTALKNRIINKNTVLNTLPYRINGHQIKDVSCHHHLSISEVLQKSSNVGVSKLALSMPASVLVDSYISLGMGKLTNIGLVGESTGKIYSYDRYVSAIDLAALSYGYGVMITPLQLAKIYATIGNMGVSKPISIIRTDSNFTCFKKKEFSDEIFPKSLVRAVIDMMEINTLSNYGCRKAVISGYRVSIKTGTTKKVGSNGKYINKYISCTAGIAPSSDPRLALVVVIDDPKNGCYYGGLVAAPLFKLVMSNALKVMKINPDFLK